MLLRRHHFDRDLEEEMRLHRELREQEQIQAGLSPREGHYAVQRRFGNDLLLREQSRDTWGWNEVEDFLRDVRYGLRTLAKNRAFTAIAVLMLSLGIGANTTIFTVVNAILLHPLPVKDISRLVEVDTVDTKTLVTPANTTKLGMSYPNFQDYARQNPVFFRAQLFHWSVPGDLERCRGTETSLRANGHHELL